MLGVYIRKSATLLDYEEGVSSQFEYEGERVGGRQSVEQKEEIGLIDLNSNSAKIGI